MSALSRDEGDYLAGRSMDAARVALAQGDRDMTSARRQVMDTKRKRHAWRLVDERGDGGSIYVDMGPDFDFLEVRDEFAHLIAAAPDMLAALKSLSNVARSYISAASADDIVALEEARAAIAKAEGTDK